ncbi:hypothetical protein GCM10022403_052340 [Streptomyces coacervatus]|uniref:Uncharacterized protein n=1 Tax=Streptomyces coacervatus TaxID=647381 RepID=A0ABP7I8C7_9ACTN
MAEGESTAASLVALRMRALYGCARGGAAAGRCRPAACARPHPAAARRYRGTAGAAGAVHRAGGRGRTLRLLDLNRTVWEGLPDGESVRDYLEDNRLAFLDAARAVMN